MVDQNEAGNADAETANSPGLEDANALLSRLRLIEDQPLEARAAAFSQVHDELRATLEGGDAPQQHG
jgi:hypothetical protein